MKKFFSIKKDKYTFEIFDLTTLLTVLNVAFILMGFWWAPIIGIANCGIFIALNIIKRAHINNYICQLALLVLNIYFLT